MAIVASVFPRIIKSRLEDEVKAYKQNQALLSALLLLAFSAAATLSFSSVPLINFLYGAEYAEAATILRVHAWAGIFVALGFAGGRWFINEGLQMFQLYKTILGAVANILLNYILIPNFGAVGAAISTLISFSIAAYFSDLIFTATRPMFYMKTKTLRLEGLGSVGRNP